MDPNLFLNVKMVRVVKDGYLGLLGVGRVSRHSVTLNVNKFLRGGKGWLGSTWQA